MIAGSIIDSAWMDAIEHNPSEPTLFIAEGVFYYLTGTEVESLYSRSIMDAQAIVGGGNPLANERRKVEFERLHNLQGSDVA